MSGAVQRCLCVVLDTNQWEAHTMLRSHLSASLIYLVEQQSGTLGVPEVVAIEVNDHLLATFKASAGKVTAGLDRVRMILGKAPDPEMPGERAASEALEARLRELGSLVVHVPLQDRHHVAAGQMVLSGMAPNAPRSQQFKDCLLWQAVIDLAGDYDVVLVSNDGGFYADTDSDQLHPDLVPSANGITLIRSMEDAVRLLQETVPTLDLDPIFHAVERELRSRVEAMGAPRGFVVEGINNASADTFVTGHPGEILVVFEMTHDLVGPADELGRVITVGEALVRDGAVTSLRPDSMEFEIYGERGFGPAGRNVFLHAGVALAGARQREHQLRVPSPGPAQTRLL